MEIFYDLEKIERDEKTVITLGTFDGIHLGHRKILEILVQKSTVLGGRNMLVTYQPHPRSVIVKDKKVRLLSTLDEKIPILESVGVQNLLVINFTMEFSQKTSYEFVKEYLVDKIGVNEIVIGYNHHFGKGRDGNESALKKMGEEFGFKVSPVEAVCIDNITVSSTKIRNALSEGNIGLANKLLARRYSFSGVVVQGDKRGRDLGFPTANIENFGENKFLPKIGIYLVEILVEDKNYFGLMSIGKRPTFYESGDVTTEVYIMDFSKEIYGQKVTVNIIERIRDEEKFSSVDELIAQMKKDEEKGLEIINKIN
ncbi:MAG TPA: bifunctional riboflavin kinase/FAD synthetase [Ignavibacteria bacterium]|nr:bifunctional riboflavin kinase/FAD synthetase [Ignavibacteria bacterium]